MNPGTPSKGSLTLTRILITWWPLAASWMLMGLELPALSAVIARLDNPEINLAAFGGIVFPLALIIESPILMLLAASTALCKDLASYRKIYRFMMWSSVILTTLHILVAFTPIYYLVVRDIIGAPEEIIEPARIGLKIMLPWTWAIAFRRFNQGMLIRFGHSSAVSTGTLTRLFANMLILLVGYSIGNIPGITLATIAVATGVTTEAIYIGIRSRPVIWNEVMFAPPANPPLTYRAFLDFYIPLAMTSLLALIVQPIGSAALSRMPQALDSLAVWPVISGFIFLMRGMGIAFNEVVVTLIDEPGSYKNLRVFTIFLTISTSLIILLMGVTPLSEFWFSQISALSPALAQLAKIGLWLALLMPGLSALQSWYQGAILSSKKTRGITEAVIIFIVIIIVLLAVGVVFQKIIGLYVGISANVVGMVVQTLWLWYRSRLPLAKKKNEVS